MRRLSCLLAIALMSLPACKDSPPTDQELLAQLGSSDQAVSRRALELLARRKHPEGLRHYRSILQNGDTGVRAFAARLLAESGDLEAVPQMLAALRPSSAVEAESLAYHLGQRTDGPTELLLQPLGSSEDPAVEHFTSAIIFGLGQMRQTQALPHIVAATNASSFTIRQASKTALIALGSQSLPIMQKEYQRPGNHSLHGANVLFEAAAGMDDAAAIPLLISGLTDGNVFAREAAADGLRRLGPRARSALESAARSEDKRLADAAVAVLKSLASPPPGR